MVADVRPRTGPRVGVRRRVVGVDRVDRDAHLVDERRVRVADLLEVGAGVAVLQTEDRLVADVPHEHGRVVLVLLDPAQDVGLGLVLVRRVGAVVDAAARPRAAARHEPEARDDADVVLGRGVEDRARVGARAPGAGRVAVDVGEALHARTGLLGVRAAPREPAHGVRLAVHLEVPVAIRADDLDDARARVLDRDRRVARVHVVGERVGRVTGVGRVRGVGRTRAARLAEDAELVERVAVAAGARGRQDAHVAALPVHVEDVRAAVALGRGVERPPRRAVVGDLDLVRGGVRALPDQLDPVDARVLLQVDPEPLGVAPGAGPARAEVAVDRLVRGVPGPVVLDGRRGGGLALGQEHRLGARGRRGHDERRARERAGGQRRERGAGRSASAGSPGGGGGCGAHRVRLPLRPPQVCVDPGHSSSSSRALSRGAAAEV